MKLDRKTRELVDHINQHLNDHPELVEDERFHGLFKARVKSVLRKRKKLVSDGDQGDGDVASASQKPRLEQ